MRLRIGIVSFAHPHAFSYLKKLKMNPSVEWVGFYDDDKERGDEVEEKYNIDRFSSIKDLLNESLDGVIVASENAKHKEHVLEIAPYKVSILCEKPLSINLADAREMIEVCNKHDVDLGICYPVRYLSSIREMKKKINDGIIGKIQHISASNHGSYPGRWFAKPGLSGGGAIMDHTVHVADIVYWITGAKPTKVVAMTNKMRDELVVEDVGLLSVDWDQDFDMTLDCSWSRNKHFPTWGDVKFKIYGDKGVLKVDSLNQVLEIYSDKRDRALWDYWGDDMDQLMINDFIDSLIEKKPFSVPAEDGLVSLEVVEMAYNFLKKCL
jgi:predicted dehydrogenase